MQYRYCPAIIILSIFYLGCTPRLMVNQTSQSLAAVDLKPFGRTIINAKQQLELITSASHFGFSFEGNECQIEVSLPNGNGHNYLQYELDGEYGKKIRVEGNATQPIVLTAQKQGMHSVWVYKATEAHTGAIIIGKITAKGVKPLQRPSVPLIEFIGNSITCGAAADASEVPCGKGEYHDQHNAYYAYGPRVARELKTNFILSSVSGIGIYRNWNSDAPIMPGVYEKADFQENSSSLWNFSLYTPDIVSIALGTNDLSRGDGVKKRLPFDSALFVNKYVEFVQLVKSKYPRAQIALLSSPMAGGNDRLLLQNCLSAVKQRIDGLYPSGKRVEIFFFQPMQPRGCTSHPSVEDHGLLAQQLVPFFRKLQL